MRLRRAPDASASRSSVVRFSAAGRRPGACCRRCARARAGSASCSKSATSRSISMPPSGRTMSPVCDAARAPVELRRARSRGEICVRPGDSANVRSITFSSWRTLPGQPNAISACCASWPSVTRPRGGIATSRRNRSRKCCASSGMSARRSRSDGRRTGMTFSR